MALPEAPINTDPYSEYHIGRIRSSGQNLLEHRLVLPPATLQKHNLEQLCKLLILLHNGREDVARANINNPEVIDATLRDILTK